MSALILSNPYVSPQTQVPAVLDAQPSIAISVTPNSGSGAGLAQDNTGSGSGFGTRRDPQSFAAHIKALRQPLIPTDATRASVVDAQLQEIKPQTNPNGTSRLMPSAFPEEAKSKEFSESVGPDLPEVEMPYPLPTSPILLRR